MALESATYISGLNSLYPETGDAKTEGDDHLRLIKSTLIATFPNITGAVTPTHTAINETASFLQDGTDAVTRTGRAKMRDFVSVKDFGATGDGVTNDTAAIQAAVDAHSTVYFPPGSYKITTTITLASDAKIIGSGLKASILLAWGVDAFTIPASTDYVSISDMELREYTALGVVDSRAKSAIKCNGGSSTACNSHRYSNLYLRGWNIGVEWKYTWSSVVDSVQTINCNYGVKLFGQSVNNVITSSILGANSGTASIWTQKDGATAGEGLMVDSCLMAEGAYGLLSDGFLRFGVTNCVIDLITNTGIDLTNAPSSSFADNWIVASNYGIRFQALGVSAPQKCAITGNYILCSAASNAKNIFVEGNNSLVTVVGNSLEQGASTGTYRLVYVDGFGVAVTGNTFTNGGTNSSVFFNGADCVFSENSGANTCVWNIEASSPYSPDNGNADKTLTVGSSSATQNWNTTLTTDRAVTLSTTGAYEGAKFRVIRQSAATGAFNLNVGTGPLKALSAANQWCDVEYDGAAWRLTAAGSL